MNNNHIWRVNYSRGTRARCGRGSSLAVPFPHLIICVLLQQTGDNGLIICFFPGRQIKRYLPPVCSAETGPLAQIEGAVVLTECGRMHARLQKALKALVENFRVRPYGPGAKHLNLPLYLSPLSGLFTHFLHIAADVFSKSLCL